jgi:hypothetical protein
MVSRLQRLYSKVRELRSLSYWNAPTGTLKSQRTLLFKLMTDPTEQAHITSPSPYHYQGL